MQGANQKLIPFTPQETSEIREVFTKYVSDRNKETISPENFEQLTTELGYLKIQNDKWLQFDDVIELLSVHYDSRDKVKIEIKNTQPHSRPKPKELPRGMGILLAIVSLPLGLIWSFIGHPWMFVHFMVQFYGKSWITKIFVAIGAIILIPIYMIINLFYFFVSTFPTACKSDTCKSLCMTYLTEGFHGAIAGGLLGGFV